MSAARIRSGRPQDCARLAKLRHALWPESSVAEHAGELADLLAGRPPGKMPLEILVAETDDENPVGFAEVGLRSHAEGCDESHAVGYLEGWFVAASYRRTGIGAALLRAAEEWARAQGCKEMASDASMENVISQQAHTALGFMEAGRSVNYRKSL